MGAKYADLPRELDVKRTKAGITVPKEHVRATLGQVRRLTHARRRFCIHLAGIHPLEPSMFATVLGALKEWVLLADPGTGRSKWEQICFASGSYDLFYIWVT